MARLDRPSGQAGTMVRGDRFQSIRRHSRFAVAGAVIVGLMCAWLGYDLLSRQTTEERYRAAVAEADRLDPTWREGTSAGADERIPDDQNSAMLVMSSFEKIPRGWAAFKGGPLLLELDRDRPPTAEALAELNRWRDLAKEGLADARALADRPRGRFPEWRIEVPRWAPQSRPQLESVLLLIYLDAAIRIEEGDFNGAAVDVKGIVNAGRALGDEPMLAVQIARARAILSATAMLERLLARGEVAGPVLADLQKLFEDEARHPVALICYRGDRAAVEKLFGDVYRGRAGVAALFESPRSSPPAMIYSWRNVRENQTELLAQATRLVEIARGPAEQQGPALKKCRDDFDQEWNDSGLIKRIYTYPFHENFMMSAYTGSAHARHHTAANLAVLALASERFRLEHGRWPKSGAELVPTYIEAIPYDPHTGGPLHWRQTDKRLLFYSAGLDGLDGGGERTRNDRLGLGKDVGFELEDPRDRGRPAGSKP
jgi:hypothetical protein